MGKVIKSLLIFVLSVNFIGVNDLCGDCCENVCYNPLKTLGVVDMERIRWYKDMVFYQIWLRSFKDGDGDGMGDQCGGTGK